MNNFKKLISLLLAAMMVLTVCGGAFAETIPEREVYSGNCGAQGDNLNWTFYTIDGVLSIKGTGNMANWTSVSSVPWYSYMASIKVLLLYSGVTSIGRNAFNGCRQLASATIPSNVTRISASAFYGCTSLASLTIGGSVTNIADHAFCGCSSLTSIEIPESVTNIGASAFENCGSLASATFLGAPPSTFGSAVFDGCAPGFTIYYTAEHAAQWAPNGATEWNGYPIAPVAVTSGSCGSFVTWTFDPETGTLTLSGWGPMYDYESAANIPWYGLRDDITSVVIEDGITEISACAFEDCKQMLSVSIPESVTHIGHSAFFNCWSLLGVELPSGITEIDYDTFGFCLDMEYVTIPEGVTYIGFQAFAECMSLDGLVLPETLEIIDSRAFHDCSSLTSLYIPASVEYLGEQVFIGCFSLPGFEVDPDNPVFCSYEGVLFYKDMTELIFCPAGKSGDYVVPAGVTTIREEAFYECRQLTSITLPEGLLTIGDNAFCDCDALTSMLIPESVSVIGDYAFCSCDSMQFIVFLAGKNFLIGEYTFEFCPADMLICYTYPYTDTWNPDGTETEWYGFALSLACLLTYTGEYSGSEYVPYGWGVTLPVCEQPGMHYTFTFNGEPWDGSEITGDLTVTVGIEADVYNVVFFDGLTNEYICAVEAYYGQQVTPPEPPVHYGYVFVGWDTDLDNVTENLTVFAQYEVEYHTATFVVNGDIVWQFELAVGEEIVMPEYVPENGYDFIGWECSDGQCYAFMPDHDVAFYGYTVLIEYVVTIIYQYDDGTVIDEVTYICHYGDSLCEYCPEIEGYTCFPDPVCYYVTEDMVIYVTYTPRIEYELVIHYVDSVYYQDGVIVEVCDPLVTTGYYGSYYSLVNPNVAGYTHESPNEYGWIYEDTELYVMYDPIAYELLIEYVYEDGSIAAPTYTEQVLYGHPYCVESPAIEGCTPDHPYVEGVMTGFGLCVTVTYQRSQFLLTIIYQYNNGDLIDEACYYHSYGEEYWHPSPVIEGYSCYPGMVTGIMYEDTTVVVTYFPLPVYDLTIHYVDSVYYAGGEIYEVCEPLVTTGYYGSYYSLVNPDVPGYTHESPNEYGWLYENTNLYVMYDPIAYELRVDYVFENGSTAAPSHVEQVLYGHPYYVQSPRVEGYSPDLPFIEGDMYYFGLCVTVTYSPLPCPIHVILMWADGTVFSEETYTYLYGEPYSIPLPEIEGYVPDPSVIAGITSGETWFFVYYNEIVNYTLTVHCLDKVYFSQGVIYEVCEPVVFTAAAGTDYTLDLPYVEGYASGMSYTSGTLNGDSDIYVMYTPNTYTLTVHFVYADGTEAFADHVEQVLYGREYSVDVPTLPGYIPDPRTVAGAMAAGDTEIFVVYNVNTIVGDVNGDGVLSFNDISVLSMYLLGIGDIAEGCIPDFNGDGVVNYNDLTDMYLALLE